MRAELTATHKALRRVFESEEARWRVRAPRRRSCPRGGGGRRVRRPLPALLPRPRCPRRRRRRPPVLKYGTLAAGLARLQARERRAARRQRARLGGARRRTEAHPRGGGGELAAIATLEPGRSASKSQSASAISTPTPSPARARRDALARDAHGGGGGALEMARAVGRLRPARRVSRRSCRTRATSATRRGWRHPPSSSTLRARGTNGRGASASAHRCLPPVAPGALVRRKHVGGGYELTQWDHSSGLVKEAPVDYWRCLVRARASHLHRPRRRRAAGDGAVEVHAMLASSKNLADEYHPGAPASAGARGRGRRPHRPPSAAASPAAPRSPARSAAARHARLPRRPARPLVDGAAGARRAAGLRRPAAAPCGRGAARAVRHPRASAVHNQMLREYERAYGVAFAAPRAERRRR